MEYLILYTIYQLGDLIRYGIFYNKFLRMKLCLKKRKVIGIGFIWLVVVSVTCFWGYQYEPIIFLLLNVFMLGAMFSTEGKKVLLAYIPLYCFVSFLDEAAATLLGSVCQINPLDMTAQKGDIYNILIIAVYILILLICAAQIRDKSILERLISAIGVKEYILICISAFCLTMLMSLITFFMFMSGEIYNVSQYLKEIFFFAMASVLIVILLVGYMVSLVAKHKVQIEMIRAYQQKNEIQTRYYQMLCQKNEEIREFRHDFHFHIHYLNQQIEANNHQEIKKHIAELMDIDKKVVQAREGFSGNSVIDAIIYGTVFEGQDSDIEFHYKGKVKESIGIRDIDLITLLSNALENAVEACKLCECTKEIWMQVMNHNENIQFIIENTCQKQQTNIKERRLTAKKDSEYHGYGRQNMKKIVDLYDGILEEEELDGRYRVMIQLN